jgi:hypothetical protein
MYSTEIALAMSSRPQRAPPGESRWQHLRMVSLPSVAARLAETAGVPRTIVWS